MDNKSILVLWEADGKVYTIPSVKTNMKIGKCNLLGIPYNNGGGHLKYHPHRISTNRTKAIILSNEEVINKFLQNEFADEGATIPERMMIRQQIALKDDDDMKRMVTLAKDKLHYKVFRWVESSSEKGVDEDIQMS